MATLGWIMEAAQDRLYERGEEPDDLPPSYPCRLCGQIFDSLPAREQHELEHPLNKPSLYFRDRELGMSTLLITSPVQPGDWGARSISTLKLNGFELGSIADLQQELEDTTRGLYTLEYSNEYTAKKLKIELCIADVEQLAEVDGAFRNYFSSGTTSEQQILKFHNATKHCDTVVRYINGLVRYIHGLLAKDHLSEITPFEDFDKRFNQALDDLQDYETALANVIRTVIRFNRNDFTLISESSGLPELDSAVALFHGKAYRGFSDVKADSRLPVDYATEYILTNLMPAFSTSTMEEFSALSKNLPRKYRSLQDNSNLNYICWRLARNLNDRANQEVYRRLLQHDDVFRKLIGEDNE